MKQFIFCMIIFVFFSSCNRHKENVPNVDVPIVEQNNILENTQTDNIPVLNIEESIEYKLSSYLMDFMTDKPLSSISHRHQIANLFMEAFNNRLNLNKNLHDEETLKQFNRLKEDISALLNDELNDAEWYSDGQDVRNGTIKIMVCYMTLAILSPHDGSCFPNSFIDSAKLLTHGNMYDNPIRYTAVIFLELLLKIDCYSNHSRTPYSNYSREEEQIIIETLKELYSYLSDIIENHGFDEGYSINEDLEYIDSIIREIAA